MHEKSALHNSLKKNYSEVLLHVHKNGNKLKGLTTSKTGQILEQIKISHTFAIKCYHKFWENISYTTTHRGFPAGSVVKNPPPNTGDMGLISGGGKFHIPWCNEACVPQLLSLCSRAQDLWLSPHSATTEPKCPEARAPQEEAAHCDEE